MIEVEIYRGGIETPIVVSAEVLPEPREELRKYLRRISGANHTHRAQSRSLLTVALDDVSAVVIVTGSNEPMEMEAH